jgi:D-serine deaminase-like pyridoxal phosphate-dependent protein
MDPRYRIDDPAALLSPSLVIFRDLVRKNLEAMVAVAREPDRLRAHVKTHKMPALVRLSEQFGIRKHKVATIAEAEMVAQAGGTDVLVAYPVLGPNIARLARLVRAYPATTFRVIVDDPSAARALDTGCEGLAAPVPTLVDLEVGMGRTGVAPGPAALELYALIETLPNLHADGLHAYDGHVKASDPAERRQAAVAIQESVLALRDSLRARGHAVPRLVFGGTPTFPFHAALTEPEVECSPGTSTLYDRGYGTAFRDLPFVAAALLFTRVVSRPRPGRLCLDLGHKAVAADPPGARLAILDLPEATLGGQSEEHLVVDTPEAQSFPVGSPLLAVPTHICPTCALHRWAYVIEDGKVVDEWEVAARDRVIGI